MRVAYFHQYFSTRSGSVGTRSYEMSRELVARGHQVLMVCGTGVREESGLHGPFAHGVRRGFVDGIEVLQFDVRYANADSMPVRAWSFLRYSLRAVYVALASEYDVLFATSTPLTAGIPGIAARLLRGKRFVFEVRDLWPELPRAMGVVTNPAAVALLSALEFVSYRAADRLVALAPGIVEGIARRGVPRQRIALIPNGCDLALFDRDSLTSELPEIEPGKFVALFAGAHGRANGLSALLDAAVELQARGRDDICIVLVGEGGEKQSLVDRANVQGMTNVRFLASVEKNQMSALFARAHLGLQILANIPAFYDGTSPNKVFDYLAAGLPVLINYPGWIATLVATECCGFVVAPANSVAMADALECAADDRVQLQAMGRRARHVAQRDFDRKRLAAEFADWVEGACE